MTDRDTAESSRPWDPAESSRPWNPAEGSGPWDVDEDSGARNTAADVGSWGTAAGSGSADSGGDSRSSEVAQDPTPVATDDSRARDITEDAGSWDAAGDAGPSEVAGDAGPSEVAAGSGRPGTTVDNAPEVLDETEFQSALEAMLLVVDAPASTETLASALDGDRQRVERVLREMSAELTARSSGIDLRFVGDGWRYYTRTDYAPYVERMLLDGARSKLTRAALETLAVIAYRQPVTRARVSAVRGVNVDGVIRTLVARGLIAEAGADPETNGTLYVTTELFLERIGLASLAELPSLAPLLPGVDLIDEINESLETDPRYTRLKKPAEADIDLGAED